MKEIIVLRHAEKIGDDLSPAGIASCEILAQKIGHFKLVIASDRLRAVKTAELVSRQPVKRDKRANPPTFSNDIIEKLETAHESQNPISISSIWGEHSVFGIMHDAGIELLDLVKETINRLQDDERALIVSHDGTVVALENLLNNKPFDTLDNSFRPLEGIRVDENFKTKHFSS